jgi:threonine aldolase
VFFLFLSKPLFMEETILDLRSDTVTKPTPEMLEFMFSAKVGDDVFGEDPSVNELQDYAADLFGMEAALFCSSGTQTNQIAIKLHTQPGDEVICDALSHVYLYEGGGIAFNSGASTRLIHSQRGIFEAKQVIENINQENVHFPSSRLLCVENTVNKGGGACWDWNELVKLKEVCQNNNLAFHLDGARLFNALVAKNQNAQQYGQLFDTISICLSKGLGAPVGSLLLGSNLQIHKAKRIRKVMGGGMRQAGFLAAAGLFALKNNMDRLSLDHQKASQIESVLVSLNWVKKILPVETNILIFEVQENFEITKFLNYLEKHHIKAVSMGKNLVRFVFHLNQSQEQINHLCKILQEA